MISQAALSGRAEVPNVKIGNEIICCLLKAIAYVT
jgi:hypothetical protein